jgi:hypothetical protein
VQQCPSVQPRSTTLTQCTRCAWQFARMRFPMRIVSALSIIERCSRSPGAAGSTRSLTKWWPLGLPIKLIETYGRCSSRRDLKGQGIGSELLEVMATWLFEQSREPVWLTTGRNTRAEHF